MSKTAWVYGLYASDMPEEIRYIGVTIEPKVRLRRHVWSRNWQNETNLHKKRWIDQVLARSSTVEMKLLVEFMSEHEAYAAEDSFLAEYRARGSVLVNIAKGGRGGVVVAEQDLQEFYRRRAEIQATPEHRDKLSKSRMRALEDPDKRAALTEHVTRINSDPKRVEKIVAGQRRAAQTNDFRAKADATRRLPENREAARKRATELNSTAESRVAAASHAKRGWDALTPEQRTNRILKTKLTRNFQRASKLERVLELAPIVHTCKDRK